MWISQNIYAKSQSNLTGIRVNHVSLVKNCYLHSIVSTTNVLMILEILYQFLKCAPCYPRRAYFPLFYFSTKNHGNTKFGIRVNWCSQKFSKKLDLSWWHMIIATSQPYFANKSLLFKSIFLVTLWAAQILRINTFFKTELKNASQSGYVAKTSCGVI